MPEKRKIFNRSLERALQILCAFSNEKRELSLVEISGNLSIPKSTVFRLCSTLIKYNFLRYDATSRKYSLGLRLFDLGSIVFSSFSIREAASTPLTQLQKKTGESAFLGILKNDQLFYLDKRDAPENPIKFTTEIGTRRVPYFGMLGQTLLAYLPEAEVKRILKKQRIKPITRNSITTQKELFERLRTIRKQGYTIEKSEVIEGVGGIAAPVRNHTGEVVAAVGVRFIASSEEKNEPGKIIKCVCETAKRISSDLGYDRD